MWGINYARGRDFLFFRGSGGGVLSFGCAGSSLCGPSCPVTRGVRTCVLGIGRQILHHWTTREALAFLF